ncbi:MAG: DJ-1/PfpI family protein [Polyangiaceae bacterium]|jgi:transcriptional regulator GlxA family with amidase domain
MNHPIIVFPLYPGITQLDFTGPHQAFSRWPDATVIAASMGCRDVDADGLVFARLADLAKVERCDVLCVPGGNAADAMLDQSLLLEIRRLAAAARYVSSVCTGSLVLAAAGLLSGKRAATHWAFRDLLTQFGVDSDDRRVVRDGNVITGGGVTAGIDLALTIIAEMAGEAVAQAVQLALEYAPAPPCDSGRPELAPPEVLAAVQARLASRRAQTRVAAEEATRRLPHGTTGPSPSEMMGTSADVKPLGIVVPRTLADGLR